MNINYKHSISGFPILKIRKLLDKGKNCFLFLSDVTDHFKLNENEIIPLMKQLVAEGYLEKLSEIDAWTNTITGNILAISQFHKTIERSKAKIKILECIERMKTNNDNSYFLYNITQAYLFGDYLNEQKNEIEIINILLKMDPKEIDSDKHSELEYERSANSDKQFSNIVESLFHPQNEILQTLKSRAHHLQIHSSSYSSNFDNVQKLLIFSNNSDNQIEFHLD